MPVVLAGLHQKDKVPPEALVNTSGLPTLLNIVALVPLKSAALPNLPVP